MLEKAKKLRAERKQIVDEMNTLVANDTMTAEQSAKYTDLDNKQSALKTQIDQIEHADDLSNEMKARVERTATERGVSADQVAAEEAQLMEVTNIFMRRGHKGLNDEQKAIFAKRLGPIQNDAGTQSTSVGSEGGYTVPTTMADQIVDAEKFEGGMIDPGVAYAFTTDAGGQLNIPTDNDTSNEGEIVNENQDISVDPQSVKFGNIGMNAHLFSSKMVLVPFTLLNDSAFNLNDFLTKKLGQRLGRAMNRQFTLGDGASAPRGVVAIAPVGRTTAAGAVNSLTTDDLFELEHSVDPAYRKNARFMMADSTLKIIKKLKDGQGRPLWLSGIAVKEPDTINGYSYTINTKMADMAANAKAMAFGDFSKYWIRRVNGILMLRLSERFAEKGQVAFIAFQRADGQLVDAGTNPIKLLQNAAA